MLRGTCRNTSGKNELSILKTNMMKKSEQKTILETTLKNLKFDNKYFIYQCDGRLGNKFAIVEPSGSGISNITGFMTYKEMGFYFYGVVAMMNEKITFKN